MKRIIIILSALCSIGLLRAQQPENIAGILQSIERNNKELQANAQTMRAQTLETRAENNLSDPSVNYNHLFGSPQELGKTGELSITQGFDFPTVYGSRSKVNKLKADAFDKQYLSFRRQLLLSAKETCLDLILLNQEHTLLEQRLGNASELAAIYDKRLQTGDANILETNKIKMELMAVKTEAATNETNRRSKLQELAALNGNQPLAFAGQEYPAEGFSVTGIEQLRQEVIASDFDLQSLQSESEAAKKQVAVSKSGWLPKLEVGYRRNTGEGEQFNGFIVGGSIPIFENRNKVKAAKAQQLAAELQKESALEKAEAGLVSLYGELQQLESSMKVYDLPLMDQTLKLLKQALTAREISMIEYFTETDGIYKSKQEYMQLENRYCKLMAQIFKNHL